MAQRSAAEIRGSIEANRKELAVSIVKLRGEVTHLTDWRGHIARHERELKIGGAVVVGLIARSRRSSRRRRRRALSPQKSSGQKCARDRRRRRSGRARCRCRSPVRPRR